MSATDGELVHVPGRVGTGTVVHVGVARPADVLDRRLVISGRVGALVALLAFAGVLASRGVLVVALLTAAAGLAVQLGLGYLLRAVDGRLVDVLPLLVKDIQGTEYRCEVRGRLVPGPPPDGSIVEIYGRTDKSGTVRVRQLVTVGTGATARARQPFTCGLARTVATTVIVVWAAVVTVLLWLLSVGQ
ncbi:MAG TPA: hypothetical protein VH333_10010 [Pseudonocardiaceae bacterium]|jgi:hypothetical protein|nr:hypothetical protein [Pseudonocardiaceae bacterium]